MLQTTARVNIQHTSQQLFTNSNDNSQLWYRAMLVESCLSEELTAEAVV